MIDAEKLLEQKPMARMAVAAVDQPLVEPISLEDAKRHLRLEGVLDDEDSQIQMMITAARRMAEGKLNRTIVQRELAVSFDGWGCKMRLPKPPFLELLGVDYLDSEGMSQSMPVDSYYLLEGREPVEVAFVGGAPLPALASRRQPITVRYIAGYPEGQVPEDLRSWMLMQIGSLYAHRESVIAGVSVAPLPEIYERMFLQPYMVYE
jgi:uncharacterized phiE125 gp8 family phage protein